MFHYIHKILNYDNFNFLLQQVLKFNIFELKINMQFFNISFYFFINLLYLFYNFEIFKNLNFKNILN